MLMPAEAMTLALRRLQQIDEAVAELVGTPRDWLLEAESALGDQLGFECTGVPGSWNEDGTVAQYDHDGETCPIHEWLDPDDQSPAERIRERRRQK